MGKEQKNDGVKTAWHDWKRTIISTATIVLAFSVYYHDDRESIKTHISQIESSMNAHHSNARNLDERFVTRREWDNSKGEISALREEIRYLRGKIDVIYERLTKK